MRELKFRVWESTSKRMGMLTSMCLKGNPYVRADFEGNETAEDKLLRACFGTKAKHIIMLWTNLKDKNGKEIYFEDIIKFTFDDHDGEYQEGTALVTETINYGSGILYDYLETDDTTVWAVDQGGVITDLWEDEDYWDIEVIGNRFENPELLKV